MCISFIIWWVGFLRACVCACRKDTDVRAYTTTNRHNYENGGGGGVKTKQLPWKVSITFYGEKNLKSRCEGERKPATYHHPATITTHMQFGLVNDANCSTFGVALTDSLTRRVAFPSLQHDVVFVYSSKSQNYELSVPVSASGCLPANDCKWEIRLSWFVLIFVQISAM